MTKDIKRLDLNTPDGAQLNMDALYQIAPSVFTESRDEKTGELKRVVNFDALRQLLGDNAVDENRETYEFRWVGKDAAKAEAARAIDKTLRPVVEDSVDWDTTKNLYIEGDNLEVLKLLQRSYMGKVKMIYIDPPYNTGNDFVYHDDFAMSSDEYDEASGAVDDLGNKYVKNTETSGRFHSDWCNMIYPRLMVARSLLAEDGVIFISIDDNEVENLRKICDEVFGRNNFVSIFPRLTTKSGKTPLTYMISHDYVICYINSFKNIFSGKLYEDDSYKYEDEFVNERGKYNLKQPLDCNSISYSKSLDYPIEYNGEIYYPGGSYEKYLERKRGNHLQKDYAWRWSKELFEFGFNNGWIVFQNGRIYTKGYLNATIEKQSNGNYAIVHREKTRKLSTIDFIKNEYSNDIAKKQLATYKIDAKFDYPKPYNMIMDIMESYQNKDGVFLDFFSGSSSTADAIMRLNDKDKGKRRFIMVQIPELIEGNGIYNNICDIAKERIRRAGKKIKEENPLTTQDLDTGFRVFRLDESNFNPGVKASPSEYNQQQLDLFANNIKADRNDLDLLFGSILAWGLQLDLPMETEEVDGCKIYTVNDGDLVACFAEKVTDKVIEAMAEKEPLRVLFRDSCFDSDDKKINLFETFKQKLDWTDDEAFNNIRVI